MENEKDNRQKEFKETAGMEFARAAKPAGCILILLILIGVLHLCFTSGTDPIPGYEAPRDTAYYSRHLEELQTELEEHVFPQLDGEEESRVEDGHLTVVLENDTFAVSRAAILRYFEESLFEFQRAEEQS